MSLEPEESKEKPQKKRSKKARARELALKYKDLPYHQARAKIMEEIPCSRSTATKALKRLERQQAEEKAAKPSIKVVDEKEKKPEFIQAPEAEVEEIAEQPAAAPEEITPEAAQKQLDIFEKMLEGLYVSLTAKGGLTDLLFKAGVSEEMAKRTADQMYLWISRRVTPETLQNYDTILLVISHGALITALAEQALKNREKTKK